MQNFEASRNRESTQTTHRDAGAGASDSSSKPDKSAHPGRDKSDKGAAPAALSDADGFITVVPQGSNQKKKK